tara:strand:- start:2604 stop:3515 length:912 start_codon:yes stop_codon:yes gene_type:complete
MSKYNSVLVTGGSGFVGKRLKHFRPDWNYCSSKDCNLLSIDSTINYLEQTKPNAIVHLAARVGGIKDNKENQAEFFYENTVINTNLLHAAHLCGVKRVLSSLSTCAFPDEGMSYPFSESDLFLGPPAETNFSYGYTKRALHVQSISYREQYGLNYSTFSPSNIYGIGDYFGTMSSHFVASLIHKVAVCKTGETLTFWGTGRPLRQQLYVDDLCRIIPMLLEKHNTRIPIIVAPNENLSISEMCRILEKNIDKEVDFRFNGMLDGQFRKDGSNDQLKKLIGDFEFTSFSEGVKKTYNSYIKTLD